MNFIYKNKKNKYTFEGLHEDPKYILLFSEDEGPTFLEDLSYIYIDSKFISNADNDIRLMPHDQRLNY